MSGVAIDVLVGVGDCVFVNSEISVCDGAPVGESNAAAGLFVGVDETAGEQALNAMANQKM